ncbi:MAG TPA: DUF4870 domain-containing protein [Pyrinomonadaceae bacterium]|jgi:uncharacterized membrane protein|nr:DUF4870 domain-containing protein [Pyrinomonadaceae bacterium]
MQNDPPVQASPASPVPATKSSTGLDENVASLLAYVFGLVSGLIFFLIEKDSRLVRFHGMQSTLLAGVFWVGEIVLWILSAVIVLIISQVSGLLGTLVWALLSLLGFVLFIGALIGWVMCMIKAYQGQYFKLPFLGNFAEKFSQK